MSQQPLSIEDLLVEGEPWPAQEVFYSRYFQQPNLQNYKALSDSSLAATMEIDSLYRSNQINGITKQHEDYTNVYGVLMPRLFDIRHGHFSKVDPSTLSMEQQMLDPTQDLKYQRDGKLILTIPNIYTYALKVAHRDGVVSGSGKKEIKLAVLKRTMVNLFYFNGESLGCLCARPTVPVPSESSHRGNRQVSFRDTNTALNPNDLIAGTVSYAQQNLGHFDLSSLSINLTYNNIQNAGDVNMGSNGVPPPGDSQPTNAELLEAIEQQGQQTNTVIQQQGEETVKAVKEQGEQTQATVHQAKDEITSTVKTPKPARVRTPSPPAPSGRTNSPACNLFGAIATAGEESPPYLQKCLNQRARDITHLHNEIKTGELDLPETVFGDVHSLNGPDDLFKKLENKILYYESGDSPGTFLFVSYSTYEHVKYVEDSDQVSGQLLPQLGFDITHYVNVEFLDENLEDHEGRLDLNSQTIETAQPMLEQVLQALVLGMSIVTCTVESSAVEGTARVPVSGGTLQTMTVPIEGSAYTVAFDKAHLLTTQLGALAKSKVPIKFLRCTFEDGGDDRLFLEERDAVALDVEFEQCAMDFWKLAAAAKSGSLSRLKINSVDIRDENQLRGLRELVKANESSDSVALELYRVRHNNVTLTDAESIDYLINVMYGPKSTGLSGVGGDSDPDIIQTETVQDKENGQPVVVFEKSGRTIELVGETILRFINYQTLPFELPVGITHTGTQFTVELQANGTLKYRYPGNDNDARFADVPNSASFSKWWCNNCGKVGRSCGHDHLKRL